MADLLKRAISLAFSICFCIGVFALHSCLSFILRNYAICHLHISDPRLAVIGQLSEEKVRSPRNCFTTHMLQNKELLLLKHFKIGYTDRTVSFISFKRYILLL